MLGLMMYSWNHVHCTACFLVSVFDTDCGSGHGINLDNTTWALRAWTSSKT